MQLTSSKKPQSTTLGVTHILAHHISADCAPKSAQVMCWSHRLGFEEGRVFADKESKTKAVLRAHLRAASALP